MAQPVIQRAIEMPNQFGFRFNMIAGSGVPEVTADERRGERILMATVRCSRVSRAR